MTSVGIIFSAAQLKRLCDGLSEKVGVRFNNSRAPAPRQNAVVTSRIKLRHGTVGIRELF